MVEQVSTYWTAALALAIYLFLKTISVTHELKMRMAARFALLAARCLSGAQMGQPIRMAYFCFWMNWEIH
jgi:hypothetical protein